MDNSSDHQDVTKKIISTGDHSIYEQAEVEKEADVKADEYVIEEVSDDEALIENLVVLTDTDDDNKALIESLVTNEKEDEEGEVDDVTHTGNDAEEEVNSDETMIATVEKNVNEEAEDVKGAEDVNDVTDTVEIKDDEGLEEEVSNDDTVDTNVNEEVEDIEDVKGAEVNNASVETVEIRKADEDVEEEASNDDTVDTNVNEEVEDVEDVKGAEVNDASIENVEIKAGEDVEEEVSNDEAMIDTVETNVNQEEDDDVSTDEALIDTVEGEADWGVGPIEATEGVEVRLEDTFEDNVIDKGVEEEVSNDEAIIDTDETKSNEEMEGDINSDEALLIDSVVSKNADVDEGVYEATKGIDLSLEDTFEDNAAGEPISENRELSEKGDYQLRGSVDWTEVDLMAHEAQFCDDPTEVFVSSKFFTKDSELSILHLAVSPSNPAPTELAKTLIRIADEDTILMRDSRTGRTALHIAIENGIPIDVLEALVEKGGMELLLSENIHGNNALHLALKSKADDNAIRLLLENGKEELVVAGNMYNENALNWAMIEQASEVIIETLINEGGDESISTVNKAGSNLLHYALKYDASSVIVNLLIEKKSHFFLNELNNFGQTPLHSAFEKQKDVNDSIRMVVEKGGEKFVTAVDYDNQTALHVAIQNGASKSATKFLIESSGQECLLSIKNNRGLTPLFLAISTKSSGEIVQLLMEAEEGESQMLSTYEMTPLQFAIQNDASADVIKILRKTENTSDVFFDKLETTAYQDKRTQEHILCEPDIQLIVNELFHQDPFLLIFMIDFYVQAVLVYILSFEIMNYMNDSEPIPSFTLGMLYFIIAWQGARKAMQIVSKPFDSNITDVQFVTELLQIALLSSSMTFLAHTSLKGEEMFLNILLIGLSWIVLLLVTSNFFFWMTHFVSNLLKSLVFLLPFIIIAFVLILACAIMSIMPQRVGTDDDIMDSVPLFETLMAVLSGDDWFTFLDDRYLRFFIVVGILLGLVIQTFLVAETTNYLAGLQERTTKYFWMKRYESLVGLGHFYRYLAPQSNEKIFAIIRRDHLASTLSSMERFNLSTLSQIPDERTFGLSTEEINFFKWCIGQETSVELTGSNRITVFLKRASLNDIVLPGRIFERVVFGLDMGYHGPSLLLARLTTCFLIFPICVTLTILLFFSGVASFGLMWPRSVRQYFFDGPVLKRHEQGSSKSMPDAIDDLRSWLDEKMNQDLEHLKDKLMVEFRNSSNQREEL